MTEGNYQCGVVCALRIRKVTSFFLEKEAYLYLTEAVERVWIGVYLQLLGLNLLILITVEIIFRLLDLVHWRLVGCYL